MIKKKTKRPAKARTIFSGIQPTGVPHLGNYLGALRKWVQLQDDEQRGDRRLFSIVDLHAITVAQDPAMLARRKRETYASLLAIGLDPRRSHVFVQSGVAAHSELLWLLSCHASMGYLGRMTQWKVPCVSRLQKSLPADCLQSKTGVADDADPLDASPNKPALRLGLFSYPVLQAADILLYQTTHVPVGNDQAQHLEFTRELARSFNHAYPALKDPEASSKVNWQGFKIPETILSPAKRVMSLQDPTKKMSKSDPDQRSRILINDTREEIHAKFRAALTDSIPGITYDRESRPGVSNLVEIMYYMDEGQYESPQALAHDVFGGDVSMKALKEKVATTVADKLEPIRERYNEQMARPLEELAAQEKASCNVPRAMAGWNLTNAKLAMGLYKDERAYQNASLLG